MIYSIFQVAPTNELTTYFVSYISFKLTNYKNSSTMWIRGCAIYFLLIAASFFVQELI